MTGAKPLEARGAAKPVAANASKLHRGRIANGTANFGDLLKTPVVKAGRLHPPEPKPEISPSPAFTFAPQATLERFAAEASAQDFARDLDTEDEKQSAAFEAGATRKASVPHEAVLTAPVGAIHQFALLLDSASAQSHTAAHGGDTVSLPRLASQTLLTSDVANRTQPSPPSTAAPAANLAALPNRDVEAMPNPLGAAGPPRGAGELSAPVLAAFTETVTPSAKAAAPVASLALEAAAKPRAPDTAFVQATPFAPPAQQIADRIATAAPPPRTEAPIPPIPTPVRTLTVQLQPESLGAVQVRMILAGEAMHIRVEAENPATAAMLRDDSGALADLLRDSGCVVDTLTVEAAVDVFTPRREDPAPLSADPHRDAAPYEPGARDAPNRRQQTAHQPPRPFAEDAHASFDQPTTLAHGVYL
jgi:flagellar hook-length control protein FliK